MTESIALALLLFSAATVSSQESSCPKPEDIAPCYCEVQEENFTFMNCTEVKDEEELARVFSAEFPTNHISNLYFDNNQKLKVLFNGVFGSISFEEFNYIDGVLEIIEGDVFERSQQTLRSMVINSCTTFSLEGAFELMESFELKGTNVTQFPLIDCPRMKSMKVSAHHLPSLPENPYANMPLLETVAISYITASQLPEVLFTEIHQHLTYVFIANDDINYLPVGPLSTANVGYVMNLNFNDNDFQMEEGALSGLQNVNLEMFGTSITTLEERLWRPLLENNVTLVFSELTCDCSIKWLVDEPALIDLVKYTKYIGLFIYQPARCSSGDKLADLDPADFENC